ncbi:MAG: hypothetical protein JO354_09010, partial [Verrucomicrobia bacterium]|nr:hypothetical protein [Verrucomicrobiota bacterium]
AFHLPLIIVAATVISAFVLAGVWPQFRYCVFAHNMVPNIDPKNHSPWLRWAYPFLLVLIAGGATYVARWQSHDGRAPRRTFVFAVVAVYLATLCSFWRLITRQDFMPVTPLAIILCTGALVHFAGIVLGADVRIANRRAREWWIPAAVAALTAASCAIVTRPLWHPATAREFARLRAVLTLTRPDEFVMDSKGEAIFRQRCIRAVLEPVTLERIQRHELIDDVEERCIATRTCLVVTGPRLRVLPAHGREFISRNFIPVLGGLRVAGGLLHAAAANTPVLHFTVRIPAEYDLVAHKKTVAGILDGTECHGARFLESGEHTFVPGASVSPVQFVWARAVENHYFPSEKVLAADVLTDDEMTTPSARD